MLRPGRFRARLAILVTAGLLGAACSGGGGGGTVAVTERDFSISVAPASVDGGEVRMDLTQAGPSEHDFEVLKTDLPLGGLPVEDGHVDLNAPGLEVHYKLQDIASEEQRVLRMTLPAGRYLLICNRQGHYQAGMRTVLQVG